MRRGITYQVIGPRPVNGGLIANCCGGDFSKPLPSPAVRRPRWAVVTRDRRGGHGPSSAGCGRNLRDPAPVLPKGRSARPPRERRAATGRPSLSTRPPPRPPDQPVHGALATAISSFLRPAQQFDARQAGSSARQACRDPVQGPAIGSERLILRRRRARP